MCTSLGHKVRQGKARQAFIMKASPASSEAGRSMGGQGEGTGTQPPLPQGKESTAQGEGHRPGGGGGVRAVLP